MLKTRCFLRLSWYDSVDRRTDCKERAIGSQANRISASDPLQASTNIVRVVLGMISVFMVLQGFSLWKSWLPGGFKTSLPGRP